MVGHSITLLVRELCLENNAKFFDCKMKFIAAMIVVVAKSNEVYLCVYISLSSTDELGICKNNCLPWDGSIGFANASQHFGMNVSSAIRDNNMPCFQCEWRTNTIRNLSTSLGHQ